MLMEAYSGDLPGFDSLWTDAGPNGYKAPLDDPDLLTELKRIIVHEHIAPLATETVDATSIAAVIDNLPIGINITGKAKIFNKKNLLQALEEARSNGNPEIQIGIKTIGMYFDASQPISYLDWTKFSTDRTAFATPPGAAAPAAATSAAATSITATFDPVAVANLMATLGVGSTTGSGGSSTTIARSITLGTFNYNALPSDVKTRYENKTANGIITGDEVATPYSAADSGGHRYHIDGADRLILADGTLFILGQAPNEKALIKAEIYCEDESNAGLRTWYENILGPTCRLYGVYIHPFWCFRKDAGTAHGFVCGDKVGDDCPLRMEASIDESSAILYRVLLRRGMFPKDSHNPAIVQSSPGNGYAALKSIIRRAHPVFHEEPATMVKRYPTQQSGQSLREYYKIFKDHLQLRAFCLNHKGTLDDEGEVSIFIDNAKYSLHLRRCSRDERRQTAPAMKRRYQGEQLVDTLEEFLMAADSPMWQEVKKKNPMKGYGDKNSSSRPFKLGFKKTTSINKIGFASDDAIMQSFFEPDDDDKDEGKEESPDGLHPIAKAVYSIAVPQDSKSLGIFHLYALAVNQIVADPKKAQTQTCVVCRKQHTFDQCKVLQNVDFLRSHYVRLCQMLNRDEKAKEGPGTKPRTIRPVNFVDGAIPGKSDSESDDDDDRTDDEAEDTDEEPDFPLGRM